MGQTMMCRDHACLIIIYITTEKDNHSLIFYVHQADVYISNYAHRFKNRRTDIRQVVDEHKVSWPPCRPARLCSSADVSARQT
jgi:hypothetical protein